MQPPKTLQSTNDRSVRGGGDALVDNSNERTALLGNRRERVEAVESGVTVRRRPWSLRIDFFVAILLLSEFDHIVSFRSLGIFVLIRNEDDSRKWLLLVNVTRFRQEPLHATHFASPSSRFSFPSHLDQFLILCHKHVSKSLTASVGTVDSRLTLPRSARSLSILSFVFPHESPVLSKFTAVGTTVFAFVSLIVIVAVTQLRVVEGVLTCVLLGLFIVSQIHAVISASLTDQYAPLLAPADELDPEVDGGCFASFKRVCGYTASFVGISLPLALGHIAILAATVLITIGVIIRAADASVEQPGFRYKIDPWLWTRSYFP